MLELEAGKQLMADAVGFKPNKAKRLGLHWDKAEDNLAVTFFRFKRSHKVRSAEALILCIHV